MEPGGSHRLVQISTYFRLNVFIQGDRSSKNTGAIDCARERLNWDAVVGGIAGQGGHVRERALQADATEAG